MKNHVRSSEMDLKKKEIWKTFDVIARSYDITNRLLSFGLDLYWRKKVAHMVNDCNSVQSDSFDILDLATGTGDVAISISKRMKNGYRKIIGIDMAEKMLEIGRKKVAIKGLSDTIRLNREDATALTFENEAFDVATVAFGVRNFDPLLSGLSEICRVLKPGGTAIVLEFSMPENSVIKFFYLMYLRYLLPLIGGLFSGNFKAYKYLNNTVESFSYGEEFCSKLRDSGFQTIEINRLCFGVATIYVGKKNKD
ncbi:bifunctional demethylmenaquinone methyltransferase/2-methoxy-6-polyprenyl-1,4-benzoquinol methylase UbiE [bacterium]|nr:bifunctional demethylmenaquinone methyltransferase/2-methoxy-6-polyprenyl-1,4-benzoquinol methylase UbiE [bacterium]